MSTIKLRNYQINIINAIESAWRDGAQNILLQLATGGGKTVVFSEIIKNFKGHQIAVAHRQELVSQLSLTLARSGIYHDLLTSKAVVKNIIQLHLAEYSHSYYRPGAAIMVGSVDTILRLNDPRFPKVQQLIQDEGHHVLRGNKWGRVVNKFPSARGLYPTATPIRADGNGLSRSADGVIDMAVYGPHERDLINAGFLTPYKIYAPLSDIDIDTVAITASGDYSPNQLRAAVKKSHIVGDVIANYLKFARNKSGLTFVASLECAEEIANTYRTAGVSAEVISGKTPDLLRAALIRKYRDREILQLVNVDLLGEGVDIPQIEVVSLARPTESLAVYRQQVGRALRPSPGKTHAIIIDHVNNCIRHGLPDSSYSWSLNRRDKRSDKKLEIQLKTCGNPECLGVYERYRKLCPYCGFMIVPSGRATPDQVDGDLSEISEEYIKKMRGNIDRIDGAPRISMDLEPYVQRSIINRHNERYVAQTELRKTIALWAGMERDAGLNDSEIYRKFYLNQGIDIMTVQTAGKVEAIKLTEELKKLLTSKNIISSM